MLAIQEALKNGVTFEKLYSQYGVKMRRHKQHPNLVLFKYEMTADFREPLVRECRGLVLDSSNEWRVVCRPFDKFFNYGEGHAATIDWSTARVQEKLDGSLCTLYYYGGAWNVATTGTPDASGEVHGGEKTFDEYFFDAFYDHAVDVYGEGGVLPAGYEDMSFMFELTGPLNRVVIPYSEASVTLLAARENRSGRYASADRMRFLAQWMNVKLVREFPLQSFADIAATFERMSPLQQEGYVVVDGAGNRVKVKHPGYVAVHHAKDVGPRALLEIIRTGECPEVMASLPELKDELQLWQRKYDALVRECEEDFYELRHEATQKDFALQALKRRYSGALFAMRKGEPLGEFLRRQSIDALMDVLG
jgi:RNA ligase